jgi:hypothetical protein
LEIVPLNISNLTAGTHGITGVYSGDVNFAPATSPPLAQVVNAAPGASLSPVMVSFGNQVTGTTSSVQDVTLSNTGSASLTISSISIAGTSPKDFAETNNCPSRLMVNASCTINVSFTPIATGLRNGTLAIADNGAGSPHTASLPGTGLGLAVPSGSSAIATVQGGSTASYMLRIGGGAFAGPLL